MKKTYPHKNSRLILLEFPTIKEMCLTMWRFQELFESPYPEIKNKRFSADQFIDLYSDKMGHLSYFAYWDGFNVPISIINLFKELYSFRERSNREIAVCDAVYDLRDDGYVIAYVKGDTSTIKHELCHFFYATNQMYRSLVDRNVKNMSNSLRRRLYKGLKAHQYSSEVFDDEINAYLTAFDETEFSSMFPDIRLMEVNQFIEECQIIYSSVKNEKEITQTNQDLEQGNVDSSQQGGEER